MRGVCELALKFRCDWKGPIGKIENDQDRQPDSGNPTVRDEKGACGNVVHGLASLCHEAGNGGNNGRRCPKHARTVFLPDLNSKVNTGYLRGDFLPRNAFNAENVLLDVNIEILHQNRPGML